jgi:hypothetical protein
MVGFDDKSFFLADYRAGVMREIHWELASVRISAAHELYSPPPVVASSQFVNGQVVYRVDGSLVGTSRLQAALTTVAKVRGLDAPVVLVTDADLRWVDLSHLDQPTDAVGFRHKRHFLAAYASGFMNEFHIDPLALPIPR